MAKTQETLKLEDDIRTATLHMGIFGCLEVTIGFGGKERVDFMTYDTKGIFRCYEIKVSKSDFHSKHANSFVGHYNYYVVTQELYNQIKDEIPDWIGCYIGQSCVKKPKYQELSEKVYTCRRLINGKSTEVSIAWETMLKDSFIRSLYRDSQKLYRSKSKGYLNAIRCELESCRKDKDYWKNAYNQLLHNVYAFVGRAATRMLIDNTSDQKVKLEQTHREQIIMKNQHDLALFLHSWQGKNLSVSKIEDWLKERDEDNGESI